MLTRDGGGCLSPHVTLASLDAAKRAMLFRYLVEHASATGYAQVLLRLDGRFARIKEILESVEVPDDCDDPTIAPAVLLLAVWR